MGILRHSPSIHKGLSSGDSGGFVAEYQAVYDAFIVKPSEADADAQNTFVTTLVDGDVWNEVDRLPVFASHAPTSSADSLLDWIHPTISANIATAVNAPTYVQYQGYTGNGTTSYVNSNYNASTDGVKYLLNDSGFGVYLRTHVTEQSADCGVVFSRASRLYGFWDGIGMMGGINAVIAGNTKEASIVDAKGLSVIQRADNTNQELVKNGVLIKDEVISSQSIPNDTFYFCGVNDSGLAVPSTRELSLGYFGAYLTVAKQLILYNAFQTLMTYYGTEV